ncbi:MAG: type II toxin-antitoxin system VapC family toxin [Firmicutes bacterium]|nr:type II toxin-antitoxin system VapC family toxin [Bacillota bacterium]
MDTLVEFQFTVWPVEPAVCLALSFQQGLAVYDSAYLSLALEHSSTLWTLDQTLAKTAGELNVVVKPTF